MTCIIHPPCHCTHTYTVPPQTEGRSIGEIRTETFDKVNSGLPPYQQGDGKRKKFVPKNSNTSIKPVEPIEPPS